MAAYACKGPMQRSRAHLPCLSCVRALHHRKLAVFTHSAHVAGKHPKHAQAALQAVTARCAW